MIVPNYRTESSSFPLTAHTRFHRVAQASRGRDFLHRLRGYGLAITSTPSPDASDGVVMVITFSPDAHSNQCAANYIADHADMIACAHIALSGVKL